jgi:hypothetical protein
MSPHVSATTKIAAAFGGVSLSSSRSWFRLPFVYRPRAERRESPSLIAVHWDGHTPRQNTVANLSNSGAYVLTNESWNPGEIISLTLQRKDGLENSRRVRFTVQVKAVRRDDDGVGVSFLLPKGTELRLWESSLKANIPQTEPEDVVREFRTAAAIAFVDRISPGATEQATWLLRRGLSSHRLESALEVVLHAQDLLALTPDGILASAHPDVVLRILEDGSWPEIDWIQHYWSGLLVSSCTQDLPASADLESAQLLSQFTTIQARIFAAACDGARKYVDSYGKISAKRLARSSDELIRISGTHDRTHIERDVQHLSWLGLLEQNVKWKFFALLDEVDITPTPLALNLYARCHAHLGDPASFYGVEPAVASFCFAD